MDLPHRFWHTSLFYASNRKGGRAEAQDKPFDRVPLGVLLLPNECHQLIERLFYHTNLKLNCTDAGQKQIPSYLLLYAEFLELCWRQAVLAYSTPTSHTRCPYFAFRFPHLSIPTILLLSSILGYGSSLSKNLIMCLLYKVLHCQ